MVQQTKKRPWILQETAAIAAFFAALFILLCLISYALPLFSEQPALQEPSQNWCGAIGYFLAHYLFSIFGLTAFFPVVLLLIAATSSLFSGNILDRLPYIVAGITGILLATSGLFATKEELLFPAQFITPGGYVGSLLWRLFSGMLGNVGTILFLLLVLLLSLIAAVRFSPITAGKQSLRFVADKRKLLKARQPRPQKSNGNKNTRPAQGPAVDVTRQRPQEEKPKNKSMPAVHEPVPREASSTDPEPEFVLQPLNPGEYHLPPISLLDRHEQQGVEVDREHYFKVSKILQSKLEDFGVQGEVEGISPGPIVTTYEFAPAPGIKITKIVSLADDLAMALKVDRVRIVGSIPGKAALGIEIPNPVRQTVFLRDILVSDVYRKSKSKMTLALGFDVIGRPVVADLAKMPHLLIAGATGAGKSVAINAFIASLLYKATPEEVRLLMVDPKRIELSVYEGIPHLLHPVVVEPKLASRALMWAVREMERRYKLLEEKRVKSFLSYNKLAEEKLPYIVIIVDELADLMMVASKEVETAIARLAQMARAAGMHIVLATQRPSVDVLTGLIKANFPTRISFKVSSKVDSRTILDGSGAEHLLGLGDMLFLPPGAAKLQRIHGAYIAETETERIIEFLKQQGTAEYDDSVMQEIEEVETGGGTDDADYDPKYDEAVAAVTESGQASISMVQRRLRVGYNRAARMIETMEKEGIIGPADGAKPREVLVRFSYE